MEEKKHRKRCDFCGSMAYTQPYQIKFNFKKTTHSKTCKYKLLFTGMTAEIKINICKKCGKFGNIEYLGIKKAEEKL